MNSTDESTNHPSLKEHSGAECRKCDKFYDLGMKKCPDCGSPLEPKKWYTRVLIERIVFIPTLMVILFFLSFLSSASDARALPIIIPAAYVLAHTFMGVRFKETFQEGKVPPYANSRFSIKRFLMEGIVFAVIFVILGIAFTGVGLYRRFKPE